jgi:hypothetical protein
MSDPLEPGSIHWRQSEALKRLLGENTPTGHLSWYEAAGLIKLHDQNAAWRQKPPAPSQEEFLRRRGGGPAFGPPAAGGTGLSSGPGHARRTERQA